MKKNSLWALSAALITVPLHAVFLIVGCSKNDPEESLDWEPFSFLVSENTLELSDATGINIRKYKKMN